MGSSGCCSPRMVRKLDLYESAVVKKTGIGAIDESRVHCPIRGTSLPAARSRRFWNSSPGPAHGCFSHEGDDA
jgi:hypothetical protein